MAELSYFLSLPERSVRALAALGGGLVYELAGVLLPGWFQASRLYQALAGRSLRIIVEGVGGVEGIFPPDEVDSRELAIRKTVGTGLEMASLLAVGWSPLWMLAAAADLTGGTRTYLDVLVGELKREGLLVEDVEVGTAKGLLNALEATSSTMAEAVDVPPISVEHWRSTYRALRTNIGSLPDAGRLAILYRQLRDVSRAERQPLATVSALVAASALRAGAQLGQTHVFDHYQAALEEMRREGLGSYALRLTRPYSLAASDHFDRQRPTRTESLLARISHRGRSQS
jgi:hypothetical protein